MFILIIMEARYSIFAYKMITRTYTTDGKNRKRWCATYG
jgi:hypothetical protein